MKLRGTTILAMALLWAGHAVAESNPIKNDNYKWHNAPLTNGVNAVVKGDWHVNDAIKSDKKLQDLPTGRMFVERVVLNGRNAIRLFEVHGWPVCPVDGSTCMVVVGKIRYPSSSSINFESGEVFRGIAKSDKYGNGYITNNYIVELIWNDVAFNINTTAFAKYNNGNPAMFSERGSEHFTKLNPDSDAGFDKSGDSQWTGVVQNTTDGFWANMRRSTAIRKERENQPAVSAPRVINTDN